MSDQELYSIEEAQQQFARSTNGLVWQYLEKRERTEIENDEMLTAAHTSLYHWSKMGKNVHAQRGHWLLARVYTVLGEKQLALRYANRCLEITNQFPDEMQGFDLAYAYEAMARSNALAGIMELAVHYFGMSSKAGEGLTNPEDKDIFLKDLYGGDWYGLSTS